MIEQSHSWAFIRRKLRFKKYMHPNVHSSAIYSSQDVETTEMSINWWKDEEEVTMEYIQLIKGMK